MGGSRRQVDFSLSDPSNVFRFDATHLVAASRGLKQLHVDSVQLPVAGF